MVRTREVVCRRIAIGPSRRTTAARLYPEVSFAAPVSALMRVGVIGVGAMGQNHARVYSEIADLVGIADPDVKAGGPVSNRFNVSYYTDSAHLLKEELDAVSVCVPTQLHAEGTVERIQA